MAEPEKTASAQAGTETSETKVNIYENFNYVGVKESAAYILNDVSNTFNISAFTDRFIWDVVKIDFTISAIVNIFTSAWDIINDLLLATIVDNTRTRLGKFRPYLLGMQLPLTLLGAMYWMLPLFFPGSTATYIPKLIFYFAFSVIKETADTAISLAKGGYMSTITPNPNERVRLITLAELLSGYLGEDLPRYIFGFVYDLIITNKIKMQLSTAFVSFGVTTSVISSALTLWFFLVSKERVPQSIERPNVKEGLRAILTNYPVLLMCLSDFLGGFAISTNESNYFIDVFGSHAMVNTLINIANAPSALNGSISYAFVAPLRKRFSSKALWVGADIYGDILSAGFFLTGIINRNYTRLTPMIIALGVREFFNKWAFGVNKVINADLWNEAMDYCEWKNGYRTEAMTSVAKGLAAKLARVFSNLISTLFKSYVGYDQSAYTQGTEQPDYVKFYLFAMFTIIPAVTGALGIIPMLFYDLDGKKKERMYADLLKRRQEASEKASVGERHDAELEAPVSK